MEKVIKIEKAEVHLNQKEVFKMIDCYEDSPIYEEVLQEYEEIKDEMLRLCSPAILFKFGRLKECLISADVKAGSCVVYALYSIGEAISKYSTEAFEAGDYLKGMLSDAIADSLLFSLEREAAERLRVECARRHVGVLMRLEAPVHIPMTAQQVIHKETEALRLLGIKITSGFMFEPVKSNGIVFVLTQDEKIFRSQHDCRKCDRMDCKMRNVPEIEVEFKENDKVFKLLLKENQSILDAVQEQGNYVSAVCGGKGTCGKCKIRVLEGELPITKADENIFTKTELVNGFRLACKAYPLEKVVVESGFQREETFEILSEYNGEKQTKIEAETEYMIAVDIGTTTIALQLLGQKSGQVIETETMINRQRAYGADVISRIKASSEGKKEELRKNIWEDLDGGIHNLLKRSKTDLKQIKKIAAAGNTTMVHLLMGYDCESLGVYPFTPVNIELIESEYKDIPFLVLPGISTFVGGDIAAGLLVCGFDQTDKISLLIDLGTNGEMAIGNKEKILVTSTAAGPAFEGGNIKWGMGSVAGAINSVRIEDKRAEITTIADADPIGICGTGIIEATAELVRNELVEAAGLLDEDYFDDGFSLAETKNKEMIVITQKDIREIQLAKASVRAGMETLIRRYGITLEEVDKVYLAGGFGFKLDSKKAIDIGMFPVEFADKIQTVGNSSLGGAAMYLKDENGRERMTALIQKSKEINLSADKDFNELYMDAMFFEKEG